MFVEEQKNSFELSAGKEHMCHLIFGTVLCTRRRNKSASLIFDFIYGHHVCNYSVNLKLGSVLFPLTYGIKTACNSSFCYEKLQTEKQPRLES